jgi:hypothetical protein
MRITDDCSRIPNHCPACNKTMYSSDRSRPNRAMSLGGGLLLGLAGIVAATTYLTITYSLRERFATHTPIGNDLEIVHYPPTVMLSIFTLPVALVPGLVLGWLANRLPRVRRVRCWNCGWKRKFPGTAKFESTPAPATVHDAAASSSSWPEIVDGRDPWTKCREWTYAEILGGRSADDVAQELTQQGWPPADVFWMVDKCRREVRDHRR